MKYARTFLLALEREFMSRVNIVGWFLVGAVPSVVLVFVWFSILGANQSVGGYARGDFIVYYVFVTFGWYIVGGNFGTSIGRSIRDGTISTTLLKPYGIVLGHCLEEQAWKALAFFITLPFMAAIVYSFRDIIHIALAPGQWAALILSLLLGGVNFALTDAMIGVSAFWVTDVWPLARLKDIFLSLFGGLLVPLSLMPAKILLIADVLPFKYMFYVPVSILLSKGENVPYDIGIQALYIVVLFALYTLMWRQGIRRYEAVGA